MFGSETSTKRPSVAVVGAGPAGLMAADVLARAGLEVTVFDRMASVGRKFLLAGCGGLNITHSEELSRFLTRFRQRHALGAMTLGRRPLLVAVVGFSKTRSKARPCFVPGCDDSEISEFSSGYVIGGSDGMPPGP
jgi:monoamine oxidase